MHKTSSSMSKLQKNGTLRSGIARARANSAGTSLRNGVVQISDPIPMSGGFNDSSVPQPILTSQRLKSTTSLRLLQASRDGSMGGRSAPGRVYTEGSTRRSPPRLQHKRSMNGLREASNPMRWTPSRSPRRSIRTQDSPPSYIQTKPSRPMSGPRRERSTLKTVMRRLFGKKTGQARRDGGAGPAEHHRSDPGIFITTPTNLTSHRESSLAITEITRSSALGSHSPFAPSTYNGHDATLLQEDDTEPFRDLSPQRRRVTLPSAELTPDQVRNITATSATFEQRPTSQGAANDRQRSSIGFAVTSGSNPKRRSRSAGALRDVAREHRMSPIQWRRRSDEIKYWRESLEESPFAVPVYALPNALNSGQEGKTLPGDITEEGTDTHSAEDNRRTFDFGPVASSMRNQEAVTLDERLTILEVKQMDLEYAISKLQTQGTKSPVTDVLPSRNASEDSAFSSAPAYQQQQIPAGSGIPTRPPDLGSSVPDEASPGTTPATLYSSPIDSSFYPYTTPSFSNPKQHLSNTPTIIQPSPAHILAPYPETQSPQSAQLTDQKYDALISLIKHEQSARRSLEQQVMQLQQEIHSFRPPCAREVGSPGIVSQLPALATPKYQRQGGETGVRFGVKRSLGDLGEDTDVDDTFQEVFETPRERKDFEPGGFF